MTQPAAATLGLFMSDVEGSTRIAATLGSDFARVLDEHFSLTADAIASEGGLVVSTEGDSVFAVFPSARHAIAAAVTAQRALGGHDWPAGSEVRVRRR